MGKRCWITCLTHKNVCLTKEVLVVSQIWNKSIIRITLWIVPPLTIKWYVIIVIKMVIWKIDVQLKEIHIMVWNMFRFQKELLLTLKDLRSFGHLKLRNFFCKDQRKGKISGTWTVDVQDTWQRITLDFQVLPRSRTVETFPLEIIQKERSLVLAMLVMYPLFLLKMCVWLKIYSKLTHALQRDREILI